LIGLVADVISGMRKLLDDLLYRVRKMELTRRDVGDAIEELRDDKVERR